MTDFSKFNKKVNKEELEKKYKEIKENGGTGGYAELPDGLYEVTFEKIELKERNDGELQTWAQLRVHRADNSDDNFEAEEFFENYKGKKKPCLFWSCKITGTKDDVFMECKALDFLNALEPEEPIEFKDGDYNKLSEKIMDLADEVCSDEGKENGVIAIIEKKRNGKFTNIEIIDLLD